MPQHHHYEEFYQQSIEHKEQFWEEQARQIAWFHFPKKIVSQNKQGLYEWFADGTLNMSYLCVDYHVSSGRGEQTAIIYDSPVSGQIQKISYRQLQFMVAKFAGVLQQAGVTKGDTVIIYMPMIPQTVVAMLACARIGAIHSVVFGGFAPHELAIRIDDAKPKVIVSANYGIEVDK